jgi:formylglycine-generating enzyme required for sulfatase activity
MLKIRPLIWLLAVGIFLSPHGIAEEEKSEDQAAPPGDEGPKLPGFVYVPAGKLEPGCKLDNINQRAVDAKRKAALIYEEWGSIAPFEMPGYHFGRFEITNAQWKLYLDRCFRVTHETKEQETLRSIAREYIRFRGEGVEREWRAIYAMNWEIIYEALKKSGDWKETWKPAAPGENQASGDDLGSVFLPTGLKLELYRHRIPHPWYGWCALAHMRVGREYFDIRKPPAEAFVAPEMKEEGVFEKAKFRAEDFAAFPARDISPNEQLAFAEWAGCHLASEYEWEYAVRGSRPNSEVYPFPGKWVRNVDKGVFSWADNPRSSPGPLAVDDAGVEKSDTMFGARHTIGNVFELTRTFFDQHPMVKPAPPPLPNLFNYALTAKGGSFGDGWIIQQLSVRTGVIGNAQLELVNQNRVDTLGIRLVRHLQPGEDLLRHSIFRLTYSSGRGMWNRKHLPLSFSLPRMAGLDQTHIVESESPYLHIQEKATGVAFAPVWLTSLNEASRKKMTNRWRQKRPNKHDYEVLGILRSDVVLRGGVELTAAEAAQLRADRENFLEIKEKIDRASKKKKKKRKKKKGEEPEEELVLPPKPPEPDQYEKATEANQEHTSLWREGDVGPGEWFVVYWNGFIGLANKSLNMPPDAIFMIENARKDFVRRPVKKGAVPCSRITLQRAESSILLNAAIEMQREPKRPSEPPGIAESPLWAFCEVIPNGWPRRKAGREMYEAKIVFPVKKGELDKYDWK